MSIDISSIQYEVRIVEPSTGTAYILAGASVTELVWEDQLQEIAARCSLKLTDAQISRGGTRLHDVLSLGTPIRVMSDWGNGPTLVFEGNIYTWAFSYPDSVSVVAYDPLFLLSASEDYRLVLQGTEAKDVLTDLFNQWNIPILRLDGPNTTLPKIKLSGKILDIVLTVLTKSWYQDQTDYALLWMQGGVIIKKTGDNNPIYSFKAENIEHFSDEQDITDLVTEIKLVHVISNSKTTTLDPAIAAAFKGENQSASTSAPTEKIIPNTNFVLPGNPPIKMRKILTIRANDDEAGLEEEAKELIEERGHPRRTQTFSTLDLPFLRKGDRIFVQAGTLSDYYVVAAVVHHANEKKMQITIDTTGTFKHRSRRNRPEGGEDLLGVFSAEEANPTVDENGNPIPNTSNTTGSTTTAPRGYNPDEPQAKQDTEWDCSCASTAWMLRSIGIPNADEDTIRNKMVAAGLVNSSLGLLNGNGDPLASWISYTFNLSAHAKMASFDDVAGLAGSRPIMIGSTPWNHWSGVRSLSTSGPSVGAAADRQHAANETLNLANPAPGYRGIGNTMTRDQYYAKTSQGYGMFMIWIDLPAQRS